MLQGSVFEARNGESATGQERSQRASGPANFGCRDGAAVPTRAPRRQPPVGARATCCSPAPAAGGRPLRAGLLDPSTQRVPLPALAGAARLGGRRESATGKRSSQGWAEPARSLPRRRRPRLARPDPGLPARMQPGLSAVEALSKSSRCPQARSRPRRGARGRSRRRPICRDAGRSARRRSICRRRQRGARPRWRRTAGAAGRARRREGGVVDEVDEVARPVDAGLEAGAERARDLGVDEPAKRPSPRRPGSHTGSRRRTPRIAAGPGAPSRARRTDVTLVAPWRPLRLPRRPGAVVCGRTPRGPAARLRREPSPRRGGCDEPHAPRARPLAEAAARCADRARCRLRSGSGCSGPGEAPQNLRQRRKRVPAARRAGRTAASCPSCRSSLPGRGRG